MEDNESREPTREEIVEKWRSRQRQDSKEETSTTGEIQPKTLGTIVSETFQVYGRGFLKLIVIVAIVEAIVYAVGWLWAMSIIMPTGSASPAALIAGAVVVLILSGVTYLWMQGALIHIISALNLQVKSSLSSAMLTAWRSLARMVGAALVIFLIVALAFLAIFFIGMIPILGFILVLIIFPVGIYFAVRWAFVLQAVLIEGTGPMQALSRSSELVKGEWWRTFGILFVIGVISGVIGYALSSALLFVPIAGPIIATIISTPIAIIGYTLLYYDLRARYEHVSIERASTELGVIVNRQPD